jgi:triacylglycerol lipase
LVHGSGFRDTFCGINYWGRIPEALEQNGAAVYYGGTDAWGSIESNAEILRHTIEGIINRGGVEKLHILAHSKGGLEARYLISSLGLQGVIASLTTISTPHHGVKAMNLVYVIPDVLYVPVSGLVNWWAKRMGDARPDFYTSSRQLSEKECTAFNMTQKDAAAVYYQSYAVKMKHCFSDPLYIILNPFLRLTDGDNDGLCPVNSARWGVFKGVITTAGHFGISHSGILDAYRIPYKGIDIPAWYVSILEDMAEREGPALPPAPPAALA